MSHPVTVRPIRTEDDFAAALARISALIGADAGTPEADELNVLTDLAQAYDRRVYPAPDGNPVDVIRFVMEDRGLSVADLAIYFGDQPRVSEFLAGKRDLTTEQIRRLCDAFGIPPGALLGKPDPRWKVPANRRACVLDVVGRETIGNGGIRFRLQQHFGGKSVPPTERYPGSRSFEVLQENSMVYMPPDNNYEYFPCEMVGDVPHVTGYTRKS